MNNIVIKSERGIKYLQFKGLLAYEDKLFHACYVGEDLNFRLHNHPENMESYENFFEIFNLNLNNYIRPNLNHTANIKVVEEKILKDAPDVGLKEYDDSDGVITNKKEYILGIPSADCNVILIYDPRLNVIANVHSGWRGTLNNIVGNAVIKMQEQFGCNPKDLICCFCPAIHKCHFEVDEETYKLFKEKYNDKDALFFPRIGNKWHIDLISIMTYELSLLGVKIDNIIDSGMCTVCHDEFHSRRGDGESFGLGLSIISLKSEV